MNGGGVPGPCPVPNGMLNVRATFPHGLESRDRVARPGTAREAIISAGFDLINPSIQPFDQIKINIYDI